ncbi:MAG: 50S ribosomal protein L29 [Bacteroidales bacterium]|nr:50S ribosomal protein L29 [Candidatus Liminaster caballi]
MKAQEIKNLTVEELKGRIAEEKASLESLQFNHAVSPLDNPMVIRATRRNIARLLTELKSREVEAAL